MSDTSEEELTVVELVMRAHPPESFKVHRRNAAEMLWNELSRWPIATRERDNDEDDDIGSDKIESKVDNESSAESSNDDVAKE